MKTILIVDDEFDISEAILAILTSEGYDATVCTNGREAIEYLQSNSPPRLVITDIMMPFVSGYELVRFMRASEKLSEVPVVVMSAACATAAQKDIGWNSFLKKPFNLESLVNLVRKYVGAGGEIAQASEDLKRNG